MLNELKINCREREKEEKASGVVLSNFQSSIEGESALCGWETNCLFNKCFILHSKTLINN